IFYNIYMFARTTHRTECFKQLFIPHNELFFTFYTLVNSVFTSVCNPPPLLRDLFFVCLDLFPFIWCLCKSAYSCPSIAILVIASPFVFNTVTTGRNVSPFTMFILLWFQLHDRSVIFFMMYPCIYGFLSIKTICFIKVCYLVYLGYIVVQFFSFSTLLKTFELRFPFNLQYPPKHVTNSLTQRLVRLMPVLRLLQQTIHLYEG